MKRVFLHAYDKANLGDDLFIRAITTRYPKTRFLMWSDPINKKNFSDIKNLDVIGTFSLLPRVLGKIRESLAVRYKNWREKRCDAFVYIGGSVFMEYPHWEQYVQWWNNKAENHAMYVIGANWGPYVTEAYRVGIGRAISKMQDVCFRDLYSYEQFVGLSTVRYAPDILLSYPMPVTPTIRKQIFVSLINCDCDDHASLRKYHASYLDNMVHILQGYLDEGCSIILCAFCKKEEDDRAVTEVMKRLSCSNQFAKISALIYDGTNGNEILSTIAASDYVIATRFHGVILALAAGRPVLPVVYSDKTLHTLNSIGFQGNVFDLRKGENWSFSNSRQNWKSIPFAVSSELKLASLRHFEKLDSVFK